MKLTTIELDRMKRHWSGWGIMFDKWSNAQDSSLVLDALVKWSAENVGRKIYRHRLWFTEENVDKEESLVETTYNPKQPIRYCDRVVYLDIYWQ